MARTLYNQVRLKGRFSLSNLTRAHLLVGAGIGLGAIVLAYLILR